MSSRAPHALRILAWPLAVAAAAFLAGVGSVLLQLPSDFSRLVPFTALVATFAAWRCGPRSGLWLFFGFVACEVVLGTSVVGRIGWPALLLAAAWVAAGISARSVISLRILGPNLRDDESLANLTAVRKTLLVVGPVACLVTGAWAAFGLAMFGVIPWRDFLSQAEIIAAGDTTGVLIAVAVLRALPAAPVAIGKVLLQRVLPFAAAFVVLAALHNHFRHEEDFALQRRFQHDARSIRDTAIERVSAIAETLDSLRGAQRSEDAPRNEIPRAAVQARLQNPLIATLFWCDRVRHSERPGYEQSFHADGRSFHIHEYGPQGPKSRAHEQSEYIVIRALDPAPINHPSPVGLNLAADATHRELLFRSAESGLAGLSAPVSLQAGAGGERGLLVAMPVYGHGQPHHDAATRRAAWIGSWVASIPCPELEAVLQRDADSESLTFQIRDVSDEASQKVVGRRRAAGSDRSDLDSVGNTAVDLLGRTWEFAFEPGPGYRDEVVAGSAILLGLGFLILAGSAVGWLCFVVRGDELTFAARRQREDLAETVKSAHEASRRKSEFLANMSHEIRTPLTAILGYSELLVTETEPEFKDEALEAIRRSGEHLLQIINEILDLSKIEAGRMTMEFETVDLNGLVEETIGNARLAAAEKGLSIESNLDPGCPSLITTDSLRLKQILTNLVGNAIKFTDQGYVRVTLASIAHPRPGLRIEVRDSGIGLSLDQAARVFEPYHQADPSTVRRFGGSGLGLQISRQLARLLGGDISVVSTIGSGCVFTLTLPLQPTLLRAGTIGSNTAARHVTAAPLRPPQSFCHEETRLPVPIPASSIEDPWDQNAAAGALAGKRILLAEDLPVNQRLLSFYLSKESAHVSIVDDGRLVVEAVCGAAAPSTPPFDLILLDMQMPEMDGYTAAQILRDSGCRIPIIALTAHAMSGDREKCLAAGCDDFLSKPIDKARLIECCTAACRGQSTTLRGPSTPAFLSRNPPARSDVPPAGV
jgi:signal transduction histidine kinase/ActR/RegA family two-component response regulator